MSATTLGRTVEDVAERLRADERAVRVRAAVGAKTLTKYEEAAAPPYPGAVRLAIEPSGSSTTRCSARLR